MFFAGDGDFHLFCDGLRQFALKAEGVAQFPIVAFRPEMLIGGAADQLGGDADAIAFPE